MAITFSDTNKPLNPRGNDASPKGYNKAAIYSGKALSFDGVNDSVSVPYSDTLGGVWSWVSIIEADALSGYQEIFGGMYSASNATIYLKENQLTFFTNQDNLNTAFDFETGKKYHIACSQSGDTISVYVNGQAAGSVSLTIPLNSTSGTYVIGKRPTQANEFFNGKMSGVRLFNTALTAAQVADLYNNPEKIVPTGLESNLKLWLPMQEGAGTTAYDGSGNGNHGTISGATYVNAIGAPVAQTAVIDWNKGTNILENTENPDDNGNFSARGFTKNSSTETSPIGTNDAHKYTEDGTNENPGLVYLTDYSSGSSQTFKVYLKADAATSLALSTTGQTSGGNINVTTEWQQFEVTQSVNATSGPHIGGFATITQGSGIVLYMWHPQMSYGDSVYIPTLATTQTSPVLLPAGLTTGRDITGVNLFENVRKQGALNLDGSSFAEVHDNGSLDFGTGDLTMECWSKATYENTGSGVNVLMSLGGDLTSVSSSAIGTTSTSFAFYLGGSPTLISGYTTGQWYHIVGVRNGSNIYIYINGSLKNSKAQAGTITNVHGKQIGRDGTSDRIYKDQIAQPRIYNRALTAGEVLQNYNSGKNTYK